MTPEQAWGDPIDARTDIFSTGILLYEMIVGQMLYLEEDLDKLLDMVRKANIAPPSTQRTGVPRELESVVMRALKQARRRSLADGGRAGAGAARSSCTARARLQSRAAGDVRARGDGRRSDGEDRAIRARRRR